LVGKDGGRRDGVGQCGWMGSGSITQNDYYKFAKKLNENLKKISFFDKVNIITLNHSFGKLYSILLKFRWKSYKNIIL